MYQVGRHHTRLFVVVVCVLFVSKQKPESDQESPFRKIIYQDKNERKIRKNTDKADKIDKTDKN